MRRRSCETSDIDLLSLVTYFDKLKRETKQTITERWERISGWREGRLLYDIDERPNRVFVIVSGVVEVIPEGEESLSWYVGAGSVLGDDALLFGAPYRHATIPRTPLHVAVLGEWYRTLAQESYSVQSNIIRQAQLRSTAQEIYYGKFLAASKPGRVVMKLLNLAQAIQPQLVEDDVARFPFHVDWWSSQTKVSDVLHVSRPKIREAFELCIRADVLDSLGYTNRQIVLTKDCIGKLETLLSTILAE